MGWVWKAFRKVLDSLSYCIVYFTMCCPFSGSDRNMLVQAYIYDPYIPVPAEVGSCKLRSMPECKGGSRDNIPKYMIREDSSVPCPNLGVVPFTYEQFGTYCGADPSRLTSTGKNLNFVFRPCQSQSLTTPARNSEPCKFIMIISLMLEFD